MSRAMATGSPCTRSLLAPTPRGLSCSRPGEHRTRHDGTPQREQLPGQQESSPQALQGAVQLEAAPHLHPALRGALRAMAQPPRAVQRLHLGTPCKNTVPGQTPFTP